MTQDEINLGYTVSQKSMQQQHIIHQSFYDNSPAGRQAHTIKLKLEAEQRKAAELQRQHQQSQKYVQQLQNKFQQQQGALQQPPKGHKSDKREADEYPADIDELLQNFDTYCINFMQYPAMVDQVKGLLTKSFVFYYIEMKQNDNRFNNT